MADMYCSSRFRKSARVDNATMLARINEVQRLVSAEASCREEMLELLKKQCDTANIQVDELRTVKGQLVAHSGSIREVLTAVNQSLASVVEIKQSLAQIATFVINLQVSASASMFLRFLDPTRELPVIVEDALGRQLTIPPEWIECLEWSVSVTKIILETRGLPVEAGLLLMTHLV